jgi:hypothetical protein
VGYSMPHAMCACISIQLTFTPSNQVNGSKLCEGLCFQWKMLPCGMLNPYLFSKLPVHCTQMSSHHKERLEERERTMREELSRYQVRGVNYGCLK